MQILHLELAILGREETFCNCNVYLLPQLQSLQQYLCCFWRDMKVCLAVRMNGHLWKSFSNVQIRKECIHFTIQSREHMTGLKWRRGSQEVPRPHILFPEAWTSIPVVVTSPYLQICRMFFFFTKKPPCDQCLKIDIDIGVPLHIL